MNFSGSWGDGKFIQAPGSGLWLERMKVVVISGKE